MSMTLKRYRSLWRHRYAASSHGGLIDWQTWRDTSQHPVSAGDIFISVSELFCVEMGFIAEILRATA